MTRIDDLISALTSAVEDRPVSYNTASAAWDVYEGYAFALTIRAAVAAGGQLWYEDRFGNEVNSLLFRTSPGMLYSQAHPYTHAVMDFPGCPLLEAHVGVRVQGKSGVLHESDVLVLPSAEADLSRKKEVAPRGSKAIIAIECKYYAGHLSLHLARGFHGLQADLGAKNSYFISNVEAPRIQKYLTYHGRNWERDVVPESKESNFFVGALREAYKKYQSSEGALAP